MYKYYKLLRISHYIKNLLIFFPIFFAGKMVDSVALFKVLLGFIAFSMGCSFVYILNDIKDIENDKFHPIKKNRPIASGAISVRHALIISLVLLIGMFSILIVMQVNIYAILCAIVYIALNLIYSYKCKRIPLLDVVLLSSFYPLRILFGGFIANIEVSSWLFLTTICIAFFLGFGKRRGELMHINKSGDNEGVIRHVLQKYSMTYLDEQMYLSLSLGIVFYSLWAMEKSKSLVYTVPLVLIICMKYNLLLHEGVTDGDPVNTIYSSKSLVVLILLYAFIVIAVMYGIGVD